MGQKAEVALGSLVIFASRQWTCSDLFCHSHLGRLCTVQSLLAGRFGNMRDTRESFHCDDVRWWRKGVMATIGEGNFRP